MRRLVLATALLLGIAANLLAAATVLERALVPERVHGVVTDEQVRQRLSFGSQVHRIKISGGTWHEVDAHVARSVAIGDRVVKDPWSATLLVNDQPVRTLEGEALRTMLLHVLLLALVVLIVTDRNRADTLAAGLVARLPHVGQRAAAARRRQSD